MADEAARELVDYLEEYVLRPGMAAVPELYDPDQRQLLREVQATMRQQLARFRACDSGSAVMQLFRQGMVSDDGRELQRCLRVLNLPTFAYVQDPLEELARKLEADR